MKEILLLLAMFWNVENYFDTFDCPTTQDETFTPQGENHWNWKRFEKKRDDIAKGILLAADHYGEFPAFIGLAEVENSFVLNQLLENTPLARTTYKYIHKESPDSRGIDVAFIYREDVFEPLEKKFLQSSFPTRDILYVKGIYCNSDTLHIMVNHWPSKRGGAKSSEKKRKYVSLLASRTVDSILNSVPDATIIMMGDFNDTWNAASLKNLNQMRNLSKDASGCEGSYKYREEWSTIDQFLVTGQASWTMEIFAPDPFLTADETYMGVKPKRTFSGPRYIGGVSDHLPIILKLNKK